VEGNAGVFVAAFVVFADGFGGHGDPAMDAVPFIVGIVETVLLGAIGARDGDLLWRGGENVCTGEDDHSEASIAYSLFVRYGEAPLKLLEATFGALHLRSGNGTSERERSVWSPPSLGRKAGPDVGDHDE
jgi:hypothetical protein